MAGGGGNQTQTTTQEIDPRIGHYMFGDQGYLPRANFLSKQPMSYYPGELVAGRTQNQMMGGTRLIGGALKSFDLGMQGAKSLNPLLNAFGSQSMDRASQLYNPAARSLTSMAQSGYVGNPNIPQADILGFANANPALASMMTGNPNTNPYLGQMVSQAQQSGLRGFEDTAQQASRAYQANILPQLQQAQSLVPDAIRQFNEEVLPSIRRSSISGGGLGGSRQGLAEGLAASRMGDTLAKTLGNVAQSAAIGGNQTMQDILRNQSRASTDLGNIASGMYGGAFDSAQQRALGAAGIAAGLQGGAQNALTSQAGLEAGLLNSAQNRALQAGQSGVQNYLGANQLATQQLLGGLGSMSGLSNLMMMPGQAYTAVGNMEQQQQQNKINAAMQKYAFQQQEPWQRLQNYASLVNPLVGMGGTTTQSMAGAGANPLTGAFGGALMGAPLGGPGIIGGGILGALGMF